MEIRVTSMDDRSDLPVLARREENPRGESARERALPGKTVQKFAVERPLSLHRVPFEDQPPTLCTKRGAQVRITQQSVDAACEFLGRMTVSNQYATLVLPDDFRCVAHI